MKNILKFKNFFLASLALIGFMTFSASSVVHASPDGNLCGGANIKLDASSCSKDENGHDVDASGKLDSLIANIINIISVIVGVVAVIMIIIGGAKLITSGGDSGRVTSGRQTIIYAVAGLIIVALAQIIARFAVSNT